MKRTRYHNNSLVLILSFKDDEKFQEEKSDIGIVRWFAVDSDLQYENITMDDLIYFLSKERYLVKITTDAEN